MSARYVVQFRKSFPVSRHDFAVCESRHEVESYLVDFGYLDNPGIDVWELQNTESVDGLLSNLIDADLDFVSMPDFYVSFNGWTVA